MRFWCIDDPSRLPGPRIATRPDRADSRRVGRTSAVSPRQCLVLLDDGMSREAIAKVLFVDDDTIRDCVPALPRRWGRGLDHLRPRRGCRLPAAERERLKAWIGQTPPCSTREIGGWIARECGIDYQGRSGLVTAASAGHRISLSRRRSHGKLDPVKQAAFIKKAWLLVRSASSNKRLTGHGVVRL